ncbi:tetratricopeptide repeat protein [Burkholderia gladioli]|uniref:tetratricopeptide repeat protein n=1 Tax=Burkholderia gladioli TaxID=28095 RepID=UPI001640FE67|nr:tetratricopeptide repeat protein [Burkholderia gladioli]MDN7494594.1 tetratricopeptide repeat protein [Burkholderia gladioli]
MFRTPVDPQFPFYPPLLEFLREAAAAGEAGRAEARATWLDAASRLHSLDYEALARLTVTLLEHQRYGDAAEFASCLWRVEPEVAALAFNCGYALQMGGRHAEAIAPYRRALEFAPDWPSLRNNLAIAVRISGGDPAEELALLEQAVAANARDEQAWINLVVAYRARYDLARSIAAAERALALAPDSALAQNNASCAYKEAQRWDEAERCARRALALSPDDASFRFNLAIIELARGNFADGWLGHEARWQGSSELRGGHPALNAPRWRGEPLAGKTLLVWGEQGMGDLLQFCRAIPLLAEHVHREGGRLAWNSFPQMGELLSRSLGAHVDLYSSDVSLDRLPAADYQLPIGSVPWQLGLPDAASGASVPYLRADTAACDAWRARFAAEARPGERLRVGLAWTGSAGHQRNPFRRVGLDRYAAAFAGIEGVSFHSLQPGLGAEVEAARAAGLPIVDHSAEWRSFDDTAAYLGALDLVITVCTSIAHLSGALGQASWVLLDVNPHWVWQHERRDSPLYPSATLYRQAAFMQWTPVLEAVARDLRALAGAGGAW